MGGGYKVNNASDIVILVVVSLNGNVLTYESLGPILEL